MRTNLQPGGARACARAMTSQLTTTNYNSRIVPRQICCWITYCVSSAKLYSCTLPPLKWWVIKVNCCRVNFQTDRIGIMSDEWHASWEVTNYVHLKPVLTKFILSKGYIPVAKHAWKIVLYSWASNFLVPLQCSVVNPRRMREGYGVTG